MKTKICPKCRSKEIEDITEKAHGELMYFPYGSPRLYRCSKCGFTNAIFPEIEEINLKKFKDKSTKNSVRKKEISQKSNNKPED